MASLYLPILAIQVAAARDTSFVSFGVQSWVSETRWGEIARGMGSDYDEPPATIPLNTLALRMSYSQRIKDEWYIQAALNLLDLEVDPRALRLSGLVGWKNMVLSNEKTFWRAAVTPFGIGPGYGEQTDTFDGRGYYLFGGPPRSEMEIVDKATYSSTSLLFQKEDGKLEDTHLGAVFDRLHSTYMTMDGVGFRMVHDKYMNALLWKPDPEVARYLSRPCGGIGNIPNLCMSLDYRVGLWRAHPSALSYASLGDSAHVKPYLECRMQAFFFLSNPYEEAVIARVGAGMTPSLNGPASLMTDTVWAMTPEVFFDMGGRF